MGQAVEWSERHGLEGGVTEADDLGRDDAAIADAKPEAIADRRHAGQALDLYHQAQKVGDGAADMGWLHAFQASFACINPFSEIVVYY